MYIMTRQYVGEKTAFSYPYEHCTKDALPRDTHARDNCRHFTNVLYGAKRCEKACVIIRRRAATRCTYVSRQKSRRMLPDGSIFISGWVG